ncbi:MAG: diguanylate cyclase, partial [Armatimonadetes bacterium]|nr:diguanylate cyclase [Armatimonadota bacterium]
DYLVKPFTRERLGRALERVRHLIERRQLVKERERLRRQLEVLTVQSVTDSLTGAYNRRYLDERIREEAKRAARHQKSLACLMVDVDEFKSVNDTLGHGLGDLVLQQVASRLREGMRETDILARYGGEEFTLLLPETDADGARTVAEKLRLRIEDAVFGDEDLQLRVTVSIGAACLQPRGTAEDLLRHADEALYRAKVNGRNRVVTNSPR